jgi:hypothetical protein
VAESKRNRVIGEKPVMTAAATEKPETSKRFATPKTQS